MSECEYCGKAGHTWHVHPEAVSDAEQWHREAYALTEPDEWQLNEWSEL